MRQELVDLGRVLGELGTNKLYLTCSKHRYIGSLTSPPSTFGCPECWRAYYFTVYIKTPAARRQEALDELESVIHHCVEYEDKGKFDVELLDRPEIKIEKDAIPD